MEYEKCLVELDEVLNRLSIEDLRKIPEEVLQAIKANKDKQYIWKYDDTKNLCEQNLSRKTIAILSYINMEYLLNDEEKKLMNEIYELNENKAEIEKKKKYNSKDIFQNRQKTNIEVQNNMALVVKKEEKWYEKIFGYIKNLFKKKE